MHELAIAQSIFEIVSEQAVINHAAYVREVHIKIGEVHGIVLSSLTFSFDLLVDSDPVLAGARLSVEIIPYRAHCRHCQSVFAVQNFVAQCPTCQSWSDEIISGTEFQIDAMEFEPVPVV